MSDMFILPLCNTKEKHYKLLYYIYDKKWRIYANIVQTPTLKHGPFQSFWWALYLTSNMDEP